MTLLVLDMTGATVDLKVVRGNDYTIEFQLLDGSNDPVDITGSTVKFTARDSEYNTVKINTKSNTPGNHSDPTNGKTRFALSKTELADAGNEQRRSVWTYEVRREVGSSDFVYYRGKLYVYPTAREQ